MASMAEQPRARPIGNISEREELRNLYVVVLDPLALENVGAVF
jgi:hypothetical protein